MNKYLVLIENSGRVEVYFNFRNGMFKENITFPTPYALESEICSEIAKYTGSHFKPFLELKWARLYYVSEEWGKIILNLAKVLENLTDLREKLELLEEIQFFTCLRENKLKTLNERLATQLLKLKIR